MTTNTILITGGTGFAGSHLVEALLESGEKNIHVTTYDLRESYVQTLLPENQIHQLDLTDKEKTFEVLQKVRPNQIYHLAATAAVGSSFHNTKKILDNNIELQLNLLDAVKEYAPKAKILAVGSALEYDTDQIKNGESLSENTPLGPSSPYALSKILQDMLSHLYAHTHNLSIVRVRPFNHIGERQAPGFVVADFTKQIVEIENDRQSEIRVGNLKAIRDFTDVKDIVQGYITLMKHGKIRQVYNLGSSQGYSIQEILDMLVDMAKKPIPVEIDQEKFRPIDVETVIADNKKMQLLGWKPTITLKDSLKRILNWQRTQITK